MEGSRLRVNFHDLGTQAVGVGRIFLRKSKRGEIGKGRG